MRLRNLFSSLMVLGVAATFAQAGTMTMTLTPIERYDNFEDFNPIGFTSTGGVIDNGQPGVYYVQVTFTSENGSGEKGWAGTSFDVLRSGTGLTIEPGWEANTSTHRTNTSGAPNNVAIYQVNTSTAPTPENLDPQSFGVAVSIASPTLQNPGGTGTFNDDRRNLIGTSNAWNGTGTETGAAGDPVGAVSRYPAWLGNFYVSWDGINASTLSLGNHFQKYTSDNDTPTDFTDDGFLPSVAGPGSNNLLFGASEGEDNDPPVADEPNVLNNQNANDPGTISYLFTATDPQVPGTQTLSWDQLTLVSYVPDFGGDPSAAGIANGLAQGAVGTEANLLANGQFDWTSTGAPRGIYTYSARVSDSGDPSLSDVTTLTINVTQVPEPATIAMLGLALVGCIGYIRRR